MSLPGATRIDIPTTDDYLEAGKALTRAAVSRLHGNCATCETKDNSLYLWHLSLENGETISSIICHECAKNITLHQLFITTVERLIEAAESKRSALN